MSSIKDYDITILVTRMVNSQEVLYQHRQDQTTQFQTWSFTGSTKKCPKYYYFTKQETSQVYVKLQKIRNLNQVSQEEQKLAVFKIQKQNNQLFITLIRTYQQDQVSYYHIVRLYQKGYKLQIKDKIRLGLNILEVTNIKKKQNIQKEKEKKTSVSKANYNYNNQRDNYQRVCKICHNTKASQDTPKQKSYLINPCNCRQPVHMICLQQEIYKKQLIPKKYDFLTFQQALSAYKLQCQKCKVFYYQLQRVIYRENQPYQQEQIDFQLQLEQHQQEIQRLKIMRLNQRPLRVGRSQLINQIVLFDETASRSHAWFQKSTQNENDILLKDHYAQIPKFGTLVEVSKKNQKFLLPIGQRRGIQTQNFVIIFQLKKKENKK